MLALELLLNTITSLSAKSDRLVSIHIGDLRDDLIRKTVGSNNIVDLILAFVAKIIERDRRLYISIFDIQL